MNIVNFEMVKQEPPSNDWLIYGQIQDDTGTQIGEFSPDGTSVMTWWVQQDEAFQAKYVELFSIVMAQEIAAGTAE